MKEIIEIELIEYLEFIKNHMRFSKENSIYIIVLIILPQILLMNIYIKINIVSKKLIYDN